MKEQSNIQFLFSVTGKEKLKLYLAGILSAVSSILSIAPYVVMYAIIVELMKAEVEKGYIISLAVTVGILVILRMILYLSSGVLSHIAAFTILYELRMKVVQHLSRIHMGYFVNHTVGGIKKTINEDIEKLENFIAHQIPDLAAAVVTPLVIIVYLMYLNWKLALVMLIPLLLGALTQFFMFRGIKGRIVHYHELLRNLNGTIIQYIHGMQIIKAFNLSTRSFKKYKDTTKEYADYWVEISERNASFYAVFLVLIDSGLFFIIPIGGLMYLSGDINVSTYVLFLILSANFLHSFRTLLEFGSKFSMLAEGAGKVKEILAILPQDEGRSMLQKPVIGQVDFKNVSFSYEKQRVIKDLTLSVQPQTMVALVGPSGSGKTTLGQLIGRFWDIQKGHICIDGRDIRELHMDELMNHVSFVFQDVFMLHDTISENIRMGTKATNERIIEVAKRAQIHEFIMSLPECYETHLGEGGIKLSGGEKQRIAIARALLKDSPIIVLDEVTSYSDIENEEKIQGALKELLKEKTAIVIAHRLYTIKNADQIVVLDQGRIVEKGDHQSLLNQEGLYAHLWSLNSEELNEKGGEQNAC